MVSDLLNDAKRRGKYADAVSEGDQLNTQEMIQKLGDLNDDSHPDFDPTVFQSWDTPMLQARLPPAVQRYVLQPYISWAQNVVRFKTDVVMLTHLILYFTTLVPSAFLLFYRFSWIHGFLHWILQLWYCGAFTLMKHQHIHMNGVLSPRYYLFDTLFPYLLDPLLGHTWNSYFYHHIKHHHVEGNGPDDLSTTMWYNRDSIFDFSCYVGRFFFLIWFDLPRYFARKGQTKNATRAAFWELSNYAMIYLLYNYANSRATLFTLILPLAVMRTGLMVGNWGQHAFIDPRDPYSDFLSSVTLIDVPVSCRTILTGMPMLISYKSNRFSFNDGYHTSHHLNPIRHWRDHPMALAKQKERYGKEGALVFHNIDFIFITLKLMQKDYMHLAKCLVPMGDQANMTLEEKAQMLRTRTRVFEKPETKKE